MNHNVSRPTQIAGTWYTGDPKSLADEVNWYLSQAEIPDLAGEVVGIIAPHAGHRYSGAVAGYAYRAVQGQSFDSVAVVSPFHHGHQQPVLTSAHCCYQTPLGKINVDQPNLKKIGKALLNKAQISLTRVAFDQEHAVEIQLPFLQKALVAEFMLLPLMLSGAQAEAAVCLGEVLAEVMKDANCLLVASTDLSHFFNETDANQLDQTMLKAISSLDPNEVIKVQRQGKGQACGLLAVVSVLTAARLLGAEQCEILKYSTSGEVSGDYSRVVGYGAGVITR